MTAAPAAWDVVVVGGGNAGLCAAIRAAQLGARVCLLEKAPQARRGGNSSLTVNLRFAYRARAELAALLAPADAERLAARAAAPAYPPEAFLDDLVRASDGRCDRALAEAVARASWPTVLWLRELGHAWELREGERPGAVPVRLDGGGAALQERSFTLAEELGVEIAYEAAAAGLLVRHDAVAGVEARTPAGLRRFHAANVVLASGGFECDPALRRRHLGPAWEHVRVRGVPYNTGDGLTMALALGAAPAGDWSAAHAPPQDLAAPESTLPGGHFLVQVQSRYSFQYGVTVNSEGRRFYDEGEHYGNYTYGAFGARLLAQPQPLAYQIFDDRALRAGLVAPAYFLATGTVTAETIPALADGIGVPRETLARTLAEYNRAVPDERERFSTARRDGLATAGLEPPKSNWALRIERPPFRAFPVTLGLTFTYGGLRIDPQARVLRADGTPIAGLYAAGEIVGGLFYRNYPGGSGMMAGAVFGKRAAEDALRRLAAPGATPR